MPERTSLSLYRWCSAQTAKALQDLSPLWLEGKNSKTKVIMVNRQIKLMSEEWEALLFIQTQEQANTGRRPSVNEVIGKSILNNAQELGYQDEQKHSIKQ